MAPSNRYCAILGIEIPSLETAAQSPAANTYGLLIAALLERGEPMTLEEVARRFEEAGVAPANRALASLKRCRPARAPVYRDGDLYALDPHDEETERWAFRLGLRPPKVVRRAAEPAPSGPLPPPTEPLTAAELDEAWDDGIPNSWSAQRVAICVLDAAGEPQAAKDVLETARSYGPSQLRAESARYWRRGAPIQVAGDVWSLDRDHDAVRPAREAVRDRVVMVRRSRNRGPSAEEIRAHTERLDRERRERGERLARMRRVLVHAFPPKRPEVVVLLDVNERELTTLEGEQLASLPGRLAAYDIIGAIEVRRLLRTLGLDPGERRLAELGPPQKTLTLNRRGRTLTITTPLLVQGSCGISRPFGDSEVLRRYLREGQRGRLRRRLEADAKSLYALYQYGRLHGFVRLRWGFLDEWIPAPWAHRDEPRLHDLAKAAFEHRLPLEVVVGSAPGWADPWSRAQRAHVEKVQSGWRSWLIVGDDGDVIDDADIQAARLVVPERH